MLNKDQKTLGECKETRCTCYFLLLLLLLCLTSFLYSMVKPSLAIVLYIQYVVHAPVPDKYKASSSFSSIAALAKPTDLQG